VTALALSLRRAWWRHPEGLAAGAAGAVWAVLLVVLVPGRGDAAVPTGSHAMAGHDMAGIAHDMGSGDGRGGAALSSVVAMAWWLAMVAAMMMPSVLPTVRNVALTGPWNRRQRNVGLFLTAYLTVWAATGLVAVPAAGWAPEALGVGAPTLLPGALAVAAAWELTRGKRRALRACRLVPPLPPYGSRADWACLAAGLRYGRRCVVACWALMAAMAIAGHAHLALMALLTAVVAAQRLHARGPRLARPIALTLVTAAIAATALP
jgi:predicted metal-binding membrane protein